MDVPEQEISMNGYLRLYRYVFNYTCFMDIYFDIHGFIWISMHGLAMDSRSKEMGRVASYLASTTAVASAGALAPTTAALAPCGLSAADTVMAAGALGGGGLDWLELGFGGLCGSTLPLMASSPPPLSLPPGKRIEG